MRAAIAAPGRSAPGPTDARLLALDVQALWSATRAAPWALWFLCIYLVVEYTRLQVAYPALDVIPWGQSTLAACLIAVLLEGIGPRRMHAMDLLVLAFFGWVFVSASDALYPQVARQGWTTPANWILMYYLVTRIVVTPRRLLLFWLAFFLVHLKMSQAGTRAFISRGFSFADWGVTGSPGWFQNSGEFAMEMALVVGMSWCFFVALKNHMSTNRLRFLLALVTGTALVSIIASSSRGGQLAVGLELLVLFFITGKVRLRSVTIATVVLSVGWLLMPAEQKDRFTTMGDDQTSQERIMAWGYAWEATQENPITGIGFENWSQYYRSKPGLPFVIEIHNTPLEASTELGYPGLIFFLGAVVASFWMNAATRRRSRHLGQWSDVFRGMALGLDMGMVGLFVASLFMSVLFYPSFWMTFALTTSLAETVRRVDKSGGPGRALRTLSGRGVEGRMPAVAAQDSAAAGGTRAVSWQRS